MKLISQCRHRRACIRAREPLGRGKREWGGRGGVSIQPPRDQSGRGVRATTQRRDFQVSKGRVPRNKGRDFQATKKGLSKGVGACTSMYRLCLGYTVNKPCVQDARYLRLISWTFRCGSEQFQLPEVPSLIPV
jgi:hypothetical protein